MSLIPEGTAPSGSLLRASRFVIAATIAFGTIGTMIDWQRQGWSTPLTVTAQLLEAAGCIVALWKPRIGLAFVVIPLVLTLMAGSMEADLVAPLIVTAAFVAGARPPEALAVAGLFVGYSLVRGLQNPPWWEMSFSYLLFIIPGALAGAGVRGLQIARRRFQGRVAVLADDATTIRAEERARLGAELRTLISAGLTRSRAVLDGAEGATDPSRLRAAIGSVNDACLAALTEVRALVGMLREDRTAKGGNESITGPSVSAVIEGAERRLAAARVPFRFDVPTDFDSLGLVTQTTVVKTIEEVTAATLAEYRALDEYALPGLTVTGERRRGWTILETGYPAPLVPEPEQTRRLERLRTRAEALGGTLRVSRDGDARFLRLELPPAYDRPAGGAAPAARPWQEWLSMNSLRGLLTIAITMAGLAAGAQLPGALAAGDMRWDLVWEVIGFAAAGILLWWPRVGIVPAAAATLGMLLTPHPDDLALTALLLVACLQAARVTRRSVALWLGGLVTGAMAAAFIVGSGTVRERSIVAAIVLLALPTLIAVRHFLTSRRSHLAEMVALEASTETIRTEERNLLARELHDVVAHHLSVATLQCMAYGDSADPAELRTALSRMRRSIESAEDEMQLLGRIMSGRNATADDVVIVRPTTVAEALSETLRDAGFTPVTLVDPATDDLPQPTLRTLTRVMQEGVTNILRYAEPGDGCDLTVQLSDDEVVLLIANPLPTNRRTSKLSLGFGLAGIRERVDLLGGRFSAGPEDGRWVLWTALPAGR